MKNVSLKSKILTLSSQLDQADDLWSNSHLLNMEMSPYNVRYPIILPCMHDVTNTIVKQHHVDTHYYPRNTGLCRLTELFKNMSLLGWNTDAAKQKLLHRLWLQLWVPQWTSDNCFIVRSHCSSFVGPLITVQKQGNYEKTTLCLFTCIMTFVEIRDNFRHPACQIFWPHLGHILSKWWKQCL